ncbi:MAG: DUF1080 domain-containing protein [Flavobacteriaceae bacterium]|nr:DUF1080 domain-containing protein [Bacteroidia bacterium]NNK86863.1 DUF1080 domain-containing protein [Flavobacteriaceae bacterium]
MMRINKLSLFILPLSLLMACKNDMKDKKTDSAQSIQNSVEQDWEILFDGTSYENFRGYLSEDIFPEWTITDKAMVFTPGNENRKNIITKKTYTNFILSLEWKVEKGGNSGIFWSVIEDKQFPEPYDTGPEVQVLDNDNHADGRHESGTRTAGSIYDMVPYPKEDLNPAGEWNLCVLRIDHEANEGSVTMNGKETITFPLHGVKWDRLVSDSKFKDWKGFRKQYTGHIGLQDHGDVVWYRDIKIKRL